MPLELKKATPTRLKSLGLDEKWLQDRIEEDTSLLGLGDLHVIKRERTQPSGGRIDFLMSDPESETRFEVEIMLGALDESHIIRTIEYWDVERQRFPTHDHRAVIVAEEITSRFFNVIRLLNRAVPMIALQLNAFASRTRSSCISRKCWMCTNRSMKTRKKRLNKLTGATGTSVPVQPLWQSSTGLSRWFPQRTVTPELPITRATLPWARLDTTSAGFILADPHAATYTCGLDSTNGTR